MLQHEAEEPLGELSQPTESGFFFLSFFFSQSLSFGVISYTEKEKRMYLTIKIREGKVAILKLELHKLQPLV